MTTRFRPWRAWSDLPAMQAVCSRRLAAAPGRAYVHPGDVAWWGGWPPPSDEALAAMFTIWELDGIVVGFAAVFEDEGAFHVLVDDEHRDTAEASSFEAAIHDEAAARFPDALRVSELELETGAFERWRERGFAPTDDGYVRFVRTLDQAGDLEPDDVEVRAVGDRDILARAAVTHAAFGIDRPLDTYAAQYTAFRASAAYPRGWDLLAL